MKIKKKKALLLGLAATTLFSTASCGPRSVEAVYGPPDPGPVSDSPGELSPEDNILEEVYGPPAEFFGEEEPSIPEEPEESDPAPEFQLTPEENEEALVYGPPSMMN